MNHEDKVNLLIDAETAVNFAHEQDFYMVGNSSDQPFEKRFIGTFQLACLREEPDGLGLSAEALKRIMESLPQIILDQLKTCLKEGLNPRGICITGITSVIGVKLEKGK